MNTVQEVHEAQVKPDEALGAALLAAVRAVIEQSRRELAQEAVEARRMEATA